MRMVMSHNTSHKYWSGLASWVSTIQDEESGEPGRSGETIMLPPWSASLICRENQGFPCSALTLDMIRFRIRGKHHRSGEKNGDVLNNKPRSGRRPPWSVLPIRSQKPTNQGCLVPSVFCRFHPHNGFQSGVSWLPKPNDYSRVKARVRVKYKF